MIDGGDGLDTSFMNTCFCFSFTATGFWGLSWLPPAFSYLCIDIDFGFDTIPLCILGAAHEGLGLTRGIRWVT